MAKRLIALWMLVLVLPAGKASPFNEKRNVILAVFAHPDDEAAIGPLLVKYAKTNRIFLVVLTDGRLGTKPGFPTGDSLVGLRQTETACACAIYGLQPPVFLGFPDGFDTRNGVGTYLQESKKLKEALTKTITEINPDFILTFGPDGDTGHSDHRTASNVVTEVVLKEGWVNRFHVYYLGWTARDDDKFKVLGGLNTVDEAYLNIAVDYSQAEEEQALKALDCYPSQLSAEERSEWKAVERADSSNRLYFRQLLVDRKKRTGF